MKPKEPTRYDPIVEEMRRYGNEYAARFDYDLERMVQDLRRRQDESGRKVVSFSREPTPPTAANPPTAPARPSKRRGT